MTRRWLLMLGSNLTDDRCVGEALLALQGLGDTVLLTPVLRTPARRGDGHYHNALVSLACGLEAGPLRQALKRIETALGRVRDDSGVVAIDIDPLAVDDGDGWRADPRAASKGEFGRPPVPQLLVRAGIRFPALGHDP